MNPVAAMLVAYACISTVENMPDRTEAFKCVPPRVVSAPIQAKPQAKRKVRVAVRTDKCGSMRAVWYTRKDGRRRYRCR